MIRSELGYDTDEKKLKMRIAQMLKSENYMIFVAADGLQVIGFAGLQICLAFEIEEAIMRIIAFAVGRDFQRRGVGSKLMRQIESYAEAHHISTIFVNSGMKRRQAHRFYEAQAFYKKGYAFCKRLTMVQ